MIRASDEVTNDCFRAIPGGVGLELDRAVEGRNGEVVSVSMSMEGSAMEMGEGSGRALVNSSGAAAGKRTGVGSSRVTAGWPCFWGTDGGGFDAVLERWCCCCCWREEERRSRAEVRVELLSAAARWLAAEADDRGRWKSLLFLGSSTDFDIGCLLPASS